MSIIGKAETEKWKICIHCISILW